ncbi:MAG: SURF1 family protein [Pseudomonadota bacterium]
MLRRSGRLWPTVITVLGIALGIALGNWQLGRAAQKRELKARVQVQAARPPVSVGAEELIAADLELRRVETRGVFAPEQVIFIDNRMHRGAPGYHVIMPLRVEGAQRHVLVNRGWVARPPLRSQLPQVLTPEGPVTINGTAMVPGQRTLELSDQVIEGRIWQNLTIARYREVMPLSIQPFVIQQDTHAAEDGLVRAWPSPEFGIDKHYGYAFQWFALSATLLVFYVVTQFKRRPAGDPPSAR